MQTALLDYLLTNPVNDYTLSLMAKSFEQQQQQQQQNQLHYKTMNYESTLDQPFTMYSNNNNNTSFSDTPSLDSGMFDPIDFATPMSIPQQNEAESLFADAPPDLWHDHGYDDIMTEDAHFNSPPKIPFKSSSPFYSTSPAIHSDTAFFNTMFPLTVSPQDAVLHHNDDDFPMQAAFQELKDAQKLYPEYSAFGQPTAPVAEFEEPEVMDEDEDDEDAEYDEVLVSSSDDEPDFDDDLYTQGPSSTQAAPPFIITAPIQPTPAAVHMELPNTLHFQPIASPSPSPLHDRNTLDHDSKTSRSKRIPISHAGPHRCDVVNPSTGKPCNKVFSRPYDLIRHQDTIHAPVRKTFKCEMCGEASKTFSRMDALSRHIRVKHSKA